MSGRIPKHPEDAANEVGKPSLFADLAFTEQRVNCKHRRSAAKRPVDERSSVICEAGLCTVVISLTTLGRGVFLCQKPTP
jgi:hypothetical protein